MTLRAFKKIKSDDRVVTAIQDNIEAALTPFLSQPLNDGVIISDISFVSGQAQRISHKLGRKYIGFVIIDTNTPVSLSSTKNPATDEMMITLTPNATATVSLFIF